MLSSRYFALLLFCLFTLPGLAQSPVLGLSAHATFGGSSGTTFAGINTAYGAAYTPSVNITITGFDIHLDTAGVGCATWPKVAVYDETTNAAVNGSTILLSATPDFHISLTTPVPVGHKIEFATVQAGVTCTTNPTSPHFTVEYTSSVN